MNPFWMCCTHPQLRWRITNRFNIPVRSKSLVAPSRMAVTSAL